MFFLACVAWEVEVTQEGGVGMLDGRGGEKIQRFINEVLVLPRGPVNDMEGGGLSCREREIAWQQLHGVECYLLA